MKPDAPVSAELVAGLFVDYRPRTLAQVVTDEIVVPDLAQEADTLTVPAVPVGQLQIAGEITHLAFSQLADGEIDPTELRLAEVREEIGLILDRIRRTKKLDVTIDPFDSGVVPRGDSRVRPTVPFEVVKKRSELDPLVAEDIRTRSPTGGKLTDGVPDYPLVVFKLERHHDQVHAEPPADRPRVFQVLFPWARPKIGELVFQPHLEVVGGNRVGAGSDKTRKRHGTVDAA